MKNKVYISTGSFKTNRLKDILDLCLKNNFTNLELGSNLDYSARYLNSFLNHGKNAMNFILHNYFPRPKKDFVLNLASDNKEILHKSINHCRKAIEFSARLKAPFYSVHAGFAFHASPDDLGCRQVGLPRIPYRRAYEVFLASIKELAGYAKSQRVKLAIENNVAQEFNLINGKNEILLLVDADEMLEFYKDVSSDNLFYLIDLGHLKVSSRNLKFDHAEFLRKVIPYTIAFHLNENNGRADSHSFFDDSAWFNGVLRANKEKTFIIETRHLEENEIMRCYHSVIKMVN